MLICRANQLNRPADPVPSTGVRPAEARPSEAGPVFVPRRRLSAFAETLLERARNSQPARSSIHEPAV